MGDKEGPEQMTTLETDRLIIGNFEPKDWEALREMILQYQASEYSAYDHQWPTLAEDIQGIAKWFASGDSYLAVWLKETPVLIGFVSLTTADDDDAAAFDLGYVFNFDHHGRGYATEACRALLDHAFHSLGAERVTSGTATANQPSCRLLETLGMTKTGESTASFQKADQTEQIEFLALSFAVTREEWQARSGRNQAIHRDKS